MNQLHHGRCVVVTSYDRGTPGAERDVPSPSRSPFTSGPSLVAMTHDTARHRDATRNPALLKPHLPTKLEKAWPLYSDVKVCVSD